MNPTASTTDVARDNALRYELDALRALASRVINEHTDDGNGTCQKCGNAFPCPRACLAEHNLESCGCDSS